MDLFNILNLIGGLSLFLFGMTLMGQALERRAGNRLKALRAFDRTGCYGYHPKLIGDHGHGGWIC